MLPDELLMIFLSKSQMQKIKIFYKLHFGSIQVSDLELFLNEPRKKIRRIVENLSLDIGEFNSTNDDLTIVCINKDKVCFSQSMDDETYVKIKDCLQEKYLLSSGLYKSLLFILERRYFSVLQLSKYLSYSESYTYKLVNKVKEFLKISNFGLKLSKKNETILILDGEETVIRLFHCLFLIIVSANNYWYIETIKEKHIEQLYTFINTQRTQKLSPSTLKKVHIIIGVYDSALKRGFKLDLFPIDVQYVGKIINKETEILKYFNLLYKKNPEEVTYLCNESTHLAFVLNYLTQELRSMQEKINLGKELSNNSNNSIITMCIKLVNLIHERYTLTKNNYYLLIYELCNRLIVLHYFGLYKFVVPDEFHDQGETLLFIKKCIYKTLRIYSKEPSFREITFNFMQTIIAYIDFDSPIKIYIEFQNKPEYKPTIKNVLTYIYNSDVLEIVEDYKLADIIISDRSFPNSTQKYFYFQDIFDKVAWSKLGSYLNEELRNKKL